MPEVVPVPFATHGTVTVCGRANVPVAALVKLPQVFVPSTDHGLGVVGTPKTSQAAEPPDATVNEGSLPSSAMKTPKLCRVVALVANCADSCKSTVRVWAAMQVGVPPAVLTRAMLVSFAVQPKSVPAFVAAQAMPAFPAPVSYTGGVFDESAKDIPGASRISPRPSHLASIVRCE